MKPEDVLKLVGEVRDSFQREEDQALQQHDLHKAEMALAGKYACDRVERAVSMRMAVVLIPRKDVGRAR